MEHVYVLDGLRTYIGTRNGAYRHVPAEQLGAAVLRELAARCPVPDINMIIGGNSVAGGGNITRLAALTAGLPQSIPACTVDLQCGSALEAILTGAAMIESGLSDLIIAGGFESSSTQPGRIFSPNHPDYKDDTPYYTARFAPGPQREDAMLLGAEKSIRQFSITSEEMDEWVLISHQRAEAARQAGVLTDRILPVFGLVRDEGIRPRLNRRLLGRLPCVVENGQFLNAANACTLNDGAAFIVLCSDRFLRENTSAARPLTPLARVRFGCSTGGDPLMSPATAISSIEQLLERTGYTMGEIGCVECNEAFAAIDVLFDRTWPGMHERYNYFGGALAYGHPYGASGAIIFLHLLKALEATNSRLGIASVAAAGGVGTAVLVERIN